jgi:hypothetical protein
MLARLRTRSPRGVGMPIAFQVTRWQAGTSYKQSFRSSATETEWDIWRIESTDVR